MDRRQFLISSAVGAAALGSLSHVDAASETAPAPVAEPTFPSGRKGPKRIPITMCHGAHKGPISESSLTPEEFDNLLGVPAEMGFESIDYSDLDAWRKGTANLPQRPIMIDFDHAVTAMRYETFEVMNRYDYQGNLFINARPLEEMHQKPIPEREERPYMTWDEISELVEAGWLIGSHTATHPRR